MVLFAVIMLFFLFAFLCFQIHFIGLSSTLFLCSILTSPILPTNDKMKKGLRSEMSATPDSYNVT